MADASRDVDLVIPTAPEMELTATNVAEAVGEFMRLDEEKIEEIKMALIEACINAIEHSKSEDGRINISFDIGQDELTIRISDHGKGFDVRKVRDELKKRRESGVRKRGWGLTIMEELMDDVQVDSGEDGTSITMIKRR